MGRPIICELPSKANWRLPLCLPAKPGSRLPITLLAAVAAPPKVASASSLPVRVVGVSLWRTLHRARLMPRASVSIVCWIMLWRPPVVFFEDWLGVEPKWLSASELSVKEAD